MRRGRPGAGLLAVLLALALLVAPAAGAAPARGPQGVEAKAWIVVDARSGDVLASHAAKRHLPIASTTKLMTALLVLERARLGDVYTAPRYNAGPAESRIDLAPGERMTVAEIFARHGEPYFRAVERRVLVDQLAPRHIVVATGGGTFADPQNRAAINRDGVSVWLDVPLERLIDRVPADGRRPLAADRAGFEHLYHQRRAAYEQAHKRLDAGRAGVDALVEQLLDWLQH